MTEVDAVLPEGISSAVPKKIAETNETITTENHTTTTTTLLTPTSPATTEEEDDNVGEHTEAGVKKVNQENDAEADEEIDGDGDEDEKAVIDDESTSNSTSNNNESSSNGSSSTNHLNAKTVGIAAEPLTAEDESATAMEVDGVDIEEDDEDDSKLTTSTENKPEATTVNDDDDDEGEDEDLDEEEDESSTSGEQIKARPISTADSSSLEDDEVLPTVVTDPLAQAKHTTDADDESSSKHDDAEDSREESITKTTPTTESSEVGGGVDDDGIDADEDSSRLSEKPQQVGGDDNSKDSTLNGPGKAVTPEEASNGDEPMDISIEEIPTDLAKQTTVRKTTEKANGIASDAEAKSSVQSFSGVVNLDDSDEDMPDEDKQQQQQRTLPLPLQAPQQTKENSNGPNALVSRLQLKSNNESDDAVIIGSDSESETEHLSPVMLSITKQLPPQMSIPVAAARPSIVANDDDDDDDDCVVIEDDTPAPPINDSLKRKAMDYDDLPSHKRQRSLTPASGVGQLTIKDARSLMPQDATAIKRDIYPVTITSATGGIVQQGPPKLVPMSTPIITNTISTGLSFTGLPSMTNNANLLPGLTDDMFVLEAPSFIVPYIYEKPPTDNIKEVVRALETKYALTPEDLAEADKTDEFDMTTEQNKEEKAAEESAEKKAAGKKKKKDDNDDSWSEQSEEEDDEDDDSESGIRTKVLIKEASDDLTAIKGAIKPAAAVTQSNILNSTVKPGQENYFESPLGKFFMDIGVGLVQEFVQADLLRLQKRKLRKSLSRDTSGFEVAIAALSGNLLASKEKNSPYKFVMKRCEFCNFKSESALAMANHYETPHMNGVMYKCNFCTFEIRNANEIVYHMEAMHNIKARLVKPLPYHQCPNCGFEDNGKAKMSRHQPVCAKKFRPEINLAPPNDWEAPAKIPRIKPRHGLVGTATAYQAMAAQAAAQKAALATIQAQQAQAAQARNMQAAALAAQNAAKMRARAPINPKPVQNVNMAAAAAAAAMRGTPPPQQMRTPISTNVVMPNNYQLAAGQLVQQAAKKSIGGQPSISITPLPRQNSAASGASSSKMPQNSMKPGQAQSTSSGGGGGNSKAQFVICEICDGYIKDLEQLRNHMQWMHKVKIHPKMIYNRPPLNCQKCQFRFFTDQGLERHLLGSHGLVTSSMQEAANKGKDAGRCPICGRMYQWKLLNHVSRDHHMTLKPAHLSYKCTVCTATFGMYKQFETHVYTAHSSVAKKAMETKKNNTSGQGMGGSGMGNSNMGLSRNNDALLKPLKINDEITIIPQPASKPRITNMESHVID